MIIPNSRASRLAILCNTVSLAGIACATHNRPPSAPPRPFGTSFDVTVVAGCIDPLSLGGAPYGRFLLCDEEQRLYGLSAPVDRFCRELPDVVKPTVRHWDSRELVEFLRLGHEWYYSDLARQPDHALLDQQVAIESELERYLLLNQSGTVPSCVLEVDLHTIELKDSAPGFFCGNTDGESTRFARLQFFRIPNGKLYTVYSLYGAESCRFHIPNGHSLSDGMAAISQGSNAADAQKLLAVNKGIWRAIWTTIRQRTLAQITRKCVSNPEDD